MSQLNHSRADAEKAVNDVHDGWAELVISGKFSAWQHGHSSEVQVLVDSPNQEDAIRLFDPYCNDPTASTQIYLH